MDKAKEVMERDMSFAKRLSEVKSQVEEKVAKEQKTKMLMEQMRQIQKELGIEKDEKQTLTTQFREAMEGKELPAEVEKVVETEMAKLNSLEPSSSEFNVCRTYLEWLTCLPWGKCTEENRDIKKAESVLDEDHYGLEDVKERILEHIAVSFLKDNTQGKIMCLVGPPGVGKTSIAKGLAQRIATGRVPAALRDKRVVQLDIALLLAGTRYRGDFEERLAALCADFEGIAGVWNAMIDASGPGASGGGGGHGDGNRNGRLDSSSFTQ